MSPSITQRWWPRPLLVAVAAISFAWGGASVGAQDDPLASLEDTLPEMSSPADIAPVPLEAPETMIPLGPLGGPATTAPLVLEVSLSEYSIYLPQVSGTIGTVRFQLENIGVQRHDLRVVGSGVDRKSPVLRAGQTGAVDVEFVESGLYSVYCDVGDHADRGMSLTYYVENDAT